MADKRLQPVEKNSFELVLPLPDLSGFSWNLPEGFYPAGGLFASVGQVGLGFGGSSQSPNLTPQIGYQVLGTAPALSTVEATNSADEAVVKKKKKGGLKVRIRIGNPHFRRLFSGGIAGAVSRTAVAPLETIRTHLMVGSNGNSTTEVFQTIMKTEGWKGLFRGNFVNVIRVAPSKAIEVSDGMCSIVLPCFFL